MLPENFAYGTLLTGAAIGLLAAFWSKLKALAWRFASFFVVSFTVEDVTAIAVAEYLWRHGKRSRYGQKAYGGYSMFVKPVDREQLVGWERIGSDPAVFWFGFRPILSGFAHQTSGTTHLASRLTLTFVRGTFDPDTIIKTAVDEYNAKRHGDGNKRFNVHRVVGRAGWKRGRGHDDQDGYSKAPRTADSTLPGNEADSAGRRYVGWLESEIGQPSPPDPLGPLAFPPSVDELVREAERWLASERWYKEKRIPWRRGWLFYGPPGTGKSSLARAVAVKLDLVLFVFELGTLSDSEFLEAWNKAKQSTPCMVLIEDIDAVFQGRTNVMGETGGGLNYSTFLNCVSGVEGADGVLLVVSTNHVEHIDPALGVPDETGRSSRPGRIDRAVELTNLDIDCRRRIAARILADCPDEIGRVVEEGAGDTGSQFQERCTQVALMRHWETSAGKPADTKAGGR
jgi:hypothetical protein